MNNDRYIRFRHYVSCEVYLNNQESYNICNISYCQEPQQKPWGHACGAGDPTYTFRTSISSNYINVSVFRVVNVLPRSTGLGKSILSRILIRLDVGFQNVKSELDVRIILHVTVICVVIAFSCLFFYFSYFSYCT